VPTNPEAVNQALGEFRAYLKTLTLIQIDPRLQSKFSMSDIVQQTLVEAWRDLERLQALDAAGRKRLLRRMLVNNLLDEIALWKAQQRDVRREQSLDAAADESSCRLQSWLAAEDSSPSGRLAEQERDLRLLEALAKLDARQREALVLKQYHHWTLAQIAEHLGCTIGAVAGLQARGLKELRRHLPDME
jgi:RNA polymerase sigma-70 factor (subfamily 1)